MHEEYVFTLESHVDLLYTRPVRFLYHLIIISDLYIFLFCSLVLKIFAQRVVIVRSIGKRACRVFLHQRRRAKAG